MVFSEISLRGQLLGAEARSTDKEEGFSEGFFLWEKEDGLEYDGTNCLFPREATEYNDSYFPTAVSYGQNEGGP